MKLSRFFIDRPIFSAVSSILIFIAGLLALPFLPISEYPDVVPPSVVVRTQYPGADPKVIAETVATPLEEQITGVENLLYMSTQITSDGSLALTATFKIGTNVAQAETQVTNRVDRALARLPDEVRQNGVTTIKTSPNLTMLVNLVSPDGRYDDVYLRNYALLNVKDQLSRLPGMGETVLIGAGDYAMRIWLDPRKLAAHNLTVGEVIAAVREQNIQVAAGVVGAAPAHESEFQLSINTRGRLHEEGEFENIVIRKGADGALMHLRDVARVEMGASTYAVRSRLDDKPSAAIGVFEAPSSNALDLSRRVREKMEELRRNFPEGLEYRVVYDPTQFVRASIAAVIRTLLEAIALVAVVVILFLQNWRASIIPLLAVPVSVIGTFAVMLGFGFSINTLSMFGMVLAIGIVVDDAIVVVENVERNIENGASPRLAAIKAMEEVSGPIVAIALVLCAVFVPIAVVQGLTGQFYRQFAMTIAISTVISAFNSLTLSPALAALLLPPHGAAKDGVTRRVDRLLGGFFRRFNRLFGAASLRYQGGVKALLGRKTAALLVYAALVAATPLVFKSVPPGFVPGQDKQYLVAVVQLPDAASLERTDAVVRRVTALALSTPGVQDAVEFSGLSINGRMNAANAGIIYLALDPFEKRAGKDQTSTDILRALGKKFSTVREGVVSAFPPPAVNGLGSIGGFKMMIEDRGSLGYDELYKAIQAIQAKAAQTPELGPVFSSYKINAPQLFADIDRERAKTYGVPLGDIYQALQINMGSLYVNDFNRFGHTYKVIAQADAPFRSQAGDLALLKVRNDKGLMVPLSSLMRVSDSYGPDRVQRYNAYLAADINGGPAPGISGGRARNAIERIAAEVLPEGIDYEWTDLTYQEMLSGDTMLWVFPICVALVFLVLAAQYESWTLPLAIILIVPMSVLCAMSGVALGHGENSIFTQISLFVLVGLACKNAILIVEFARDLERNGHTPAAAALEACRLRLRPILMTSLAFIMGVMPMVFTSGAGAEMRHAIGLAVFSGMLGVTLFGLFLTPLFYVLLRQVVRRAQPRQPAQPHAAAHGAGSLTLEGESA